MLQGENSLRWAFVLDEIVTISGGSNGESWEDREQESTGWIWLEIK